MNEGDLEQENVPECDCCGFAHPDLEVRKFTMREHAKEAYEIELCEICANTHIANIFEYPSHYENGDYALARTIGWIGNRILQEIKDANKKETKNE